MVVSVGDVVARKYWLRALDEDAGWIMVEIGRSEYL